MSDINNVNCNHDTSDIGCGVLVIAFVLLCVGWKACDTMDKYTKSLEHQQVQSK